MRFVPWYEEGKYDLAILHVDGECADPEGTKGNLYKRLNEVIQDKPKIVINHGTPWIPEKFNRYVKDVEGEKEKLMAGKDVCVNEMKKLIGDNTMVVNSKQAAKDWGFGTPIIHGMYGNPAEQYYDNSKEMIISFLVSPAGWDYYYNRRNVNDVRTMIEDQGIKTEQPRVDVHFKGFKLYRDYLSRILIAVIPTRTSPMPRGRTEAMLSGACVVTGNNHDIGSYFKGLKFRQTEQGHFIKTEAEELIPENLEEAEIVYVDIDSVKDMYIKIMWLYNNPKLAEQIGQRGKNKAQEVFTIDNFRNQWAELLQSEGIL